MGFLGNMKAKMQAAGAAESAHPMIPSEVNRIVGEVGWILQNGKEVDLRDRPEPNLPANAQNAVKKYQYNYLNFQQSPVKIDLYLVYMSMSATDCVYFTYVNGASVATFRMPDYIQMPPGGQAILVNRERLANEVRGFLQGFGSLIPPPPVQQQVIVTQPQPTMVMTAPPPQTMVVTAPAQPQVIVAQAPPPMMVTQSTGPQAMMCPRCGFQMEMCSTTTQTSSYTQTGYGPQPMQPTPQPAPQPIPQGQPQNVSIVMPGMSVQTTQMGTACPRCGMGPIDAVTNRCMNCGLQF